MSMTPDLNWSEHSKDITTSANKQIFQLWRLSNLNAEKELGLLCKSWIRSLLLYANAWWVNQLQLVKSIIEKTQKQSTKHFLKEASMI